MTGELTALELSRLAICERTIERGLASFKDVGEALLTIRDNKLHRVAYKTFEDYCRLRWGIGDSQADAYISVTKVRAALSTSARAEVDSEAVTPRIARELVGLSAEPEVMREVWQEAVEETDGHPTAAAVRERVARARDALPQRRQERIDVPTVMAQVVMYADRAAKAAGQIEVHHLSNRSVELGSWRTGLGHSVEVLQGLYELLGGDE